jgi:hypothetical protein
LEKGEMQQYQELIFGIEDLFLWQNKIFSSVYVVLVLLFWGSGLESYPSILTFSVGFII